MALSGGEILLELFQSNGIKYIFCSPGTEWIPVWEGLARRHAQNEKTLKYINCRHESLAVATAMGYARATGHLPAILLHANVGSLHGAMAIRAAYLTQAPMIICNVDCSHYSEYADNKGPGWWWLSQLSDVGRPDALVRPYVKWSNAVTSKETLLDSVCRGCQIAQAAPQGPVSLTIPRGLLFESLPEIRIAQTPPATVLPKPRASDSEEVAKQLAESKQPIIITERAGKKPETVGKLVELAELLNSPVFECIDPTFANFPTNHPLHMGYDASEALQEADTVFVIGSTTPWYPPSAFPQHDAKVILLDEDPLKEQLPYWGYRIDSVLTGDIGQWLSTLVDTIRTRIKEPTRPGSRYRRTFEQWRAKHEQLEEQWKAEAFARQKNKPISPQWFFYMANKVLPSDAIILEETINHRPFIFRYLTKPEGYFGVSAGGLGIGLGMTAGVKLAHEDRPVIFLVGDGSFNYNPVVAGLGLCQEHHLPILIIVLDNGGYISMGDSHRECYPEGWSVSNNTYFGVAITPRPNYAMIAEAFGAYGEQVEEPDDIEPALNRALQQIAQGRAALLDVILDS